MQTHEGAHSFQDPTFLSAWQHLHEGAKAFFVPRRFGAAQLEGAGATAAALTVDPSLWAFRGSTCVIAYPDLSFQSRSHELWLHAARSEYFRGQEACLSPPPGLGDPMTRSQRISCATYQRRDRAAGLLAEWRNSN